jgi:hypothetical protein
MQNRDDDKQLIDKLIKKRKQENDAFLKLLNAIESKSTTDEKQKSERKKS